MKKTNNKKDIKLLYVSYEEDSDIIEDNYGHDGPYSGFIKERIYYTLKDVYDFVPAKITPYWQEVKYKSKEIFDDVWVVWVQYGDGSTFSLTTGRGDIVSAFATLEEAEEEKQVILYKEHKYSWKWNDYFGGLEEVHIENRKIIKRQKNEYRKSNRFKYTKC